MKPPSRKHYEKTEVEKLRERIAKLEKEKPEALGIRRTIEGLREQIRSLKEDAKYTSVRLMEAQKYQTYFVALSNAEVFVSDDEGMKYLKGDDLEAYCKALVTKREKERHEGYETLNIAFAGFTGFAHQAIRQIIIDEIDKADVLDSFTYTTKGRYGNDAGSESKEEGS